MKRPHSSRSHQPLTVADMLGRADGFAALRAGVAQMTSLLRDLEQLLPDYLTPHVEPGLIKDGTLTLFAAHNALAARLRQIEPRLLAELQARGWPVAALKVRVRPQAAPEPKQPKQAQLSAAGGDALRTLTETLEPSPLRTALARMVARHTAKGR